MKEEIIEKLAEYAHKTWSGWIEYMFNKCSIGKDFTLIIPIWAVERWKKQAQTIYDDLSKSEKESDRHEAREILNIISEEK